MNRNNTKQPLFKILRRYGIEPKIVGMIEALYRDAKSSVLVGSTISDWFSTTVGVRQGCLLSPCLFNVFLEFIMSCALEDFHGSVRIGGVEVNNLRFADDIDLIASSVEELADLTTRVDRSATSLGMRINTSKTKVMAAPAPVQQPQSDLSNVRINNEELEEVTQFKYLGATITTDGRSDVEIRRRLVIANQKLTQLRPLWKSTALSLRTKLRLLNAIVQSTALYACQSWTISAGLQSKICAFEMKCFRRLLGISYRAHRTNISVLDEVNAIAGKVTRLTDLVKRLKLMWFGHTIRHDSFSKVFLEGAVPGVRSRGRPRLCWFNNVKDWTGITLYALSHMATDRPRFRAFIHNILFR